ncbi:MAG: TolC family protein [Planctomycetota bacterium]|nr:TolC family protein [Planctomycetota bacterium]
MSRHTEDSAAPAVERTKEEQVPIGPPVNMADGLTLDEAFNLAMVQNPRLIAVRRELRFARARRQTADQWSFNPVVSAGARGALPLGRAEDYGAGVGVSQEFEIGGQRGRRIQVAEANVRRTQAAIADAERLLREEVAATFYESLMLDELVSLAARSVEIASRLNETAEARFELKQIPEVELNLVKIQYERSKNESARIAARRREVRFRLAALLGEPSRSDLRLVGTLRAAKQEVARETALRIAKERRPDISALEARVQMMDAQISLEEARVWPNPAVGLFYEREALSVNGFSDRDHVLGFELSLPIPIWNQRRGQIAEARAETRILEAELSGIKRQIERDVDVALNRLALARESVDLFEKDLNRLSQENLEQFETAYRAGEVGTLEVLRAQEDFIRISIGYQEALLEHNSARVEFQSLLGGEIPEGN